MEGEPEAMFADYVDKNWPHLVAGTHVNEHDTIGSIVELLLITVPCEVMAVPTRPREIGSRTCVTYHRHSTSFELSVSAPESPSRSVF